MRARTLFTLLVALVLALPLAGAWGGKGGYEPSTFYDREKGYMWTATDVVPNDAIRYVYFNGWLGSCGSGTESTLGAGGHNLASTCGLGSFNPNFAGIQSGLITPAPRAYALLGVWKDCNDDGYIGWGDNLLFEYRAQLATANAKISQICKPAAVGTPFAHNDGVWVREFLPIGWNTIADTGFQGDPSLFIDQRARVWSDWGQPGAAATSPCAVAPYPSETTRTTGGLLNYVDCHAGRTLARGWDNVFKTLRRDDLTWGDPDDPRTSENDVNRKTGGWSEDPSYVTAFDCSRPAMAGPVYPPLVPPSVDPDEGSLSGTIATQGSASCTRGSRGTADTLHCPSAPTVCENAAVGNPVEKRTRPDAIHFFHEQQRFHAFGQALGRSANYDAEFGVLATSAIGLWRQVGATEAANNPYFDREALGPSEVLWRSFYAFVDSKARTDYNLLLRVAQPGSYGADACAVTPSTFECDPDKWWKTPSGADMAAPSASYGPSVAANGDVRIKVGHAYNLLDVDCYDASLTGLRENAIDWGMFTETLC